MNLWFMKDMARLAAERDALLALASRASWLSVSAPRFDDDARVCVSVEITVGERVFKALLRYPAAFPHSPPSVLPEDRAKWSSHQYGSGGELCLEYGPDNWTPDLTGAAMVASAERLLRTETPTDEAPAPVAPSRHALTSGQELRSRSLRYLVTRDLATYLDTLPLGATLTAELLWRSQDKQHTLVLVRLLSDEGVVWNDASVPEAAWAGAVLHKCRVLVTQPDRNPPRATTRETLAQAIAELCCDLQMRDPEIEFLMLWSNLASRMIWFAKDDEAIDFAKVESEGGSRLPSSYQQLQGRAVGLVGCGSAGSKIATMLARSGVGRLVLVDDDVLLPENLIRNDLDWTGVGEHKVRGVARRARLVSPTITVEMEMKRLAGQESSGVADSVLHKLQNCDLIVDATADPEVFNLLAGIATAQPRPLVWLEIFAGGIGGLVARSRPDLDPSPQVARARIAAWCDERGVPAPRAERPYEAGSQTAPLVADDADVGVIAAHAARMALDSLLEDVPSAFPASAYMIGLSGEWIFTEPFDTRRIDLGRPEPRPTPQEPSAEAKALLVQMLSAVDADA